MNAFDVWMQVFLAGCAVAAVWYDEPALVTLFGVLFILRWVGLFILTKR